MFDPKTDPKTLDTYAIISPAGEITPHLGRTKSKAIDALLGPFTDEKDRRRVWERHQRAGFRVETVTVMSTGRESAMRILLRRAAAAVLPESNGITEASRKALVTGLRAWLP